MMVIYDATVGIKQQLSVDIQLIAFTAIRMRLSDTECEWGSIPPACTVAIWSAELKVFSGVK